MRVLWVVERSVFGGDYALPAAAAAAGHEVAAWDDGWWQTGRWPRAAGEAVVFHGSLGNADRVRRELPWRPGAFCATEAFRCSAWYPRAKEWLVHDTWSLTTVRDLVARPPTGSEAVFVRPDSPLKPFSGRVVRAEGLTPASLDHGFYYDDLDLPVVVAPVRELGREWRFVVVEGRVVAGSEYQADRRRALATAERGDPWRFAAEVARDLPAPEPVYVLDVGVVDGALRLLELNPFSGADLYGCDSAAVVAAVSQVVARMRAG